VFPVSSPSPVQVQSRTRVFLIESNRPLRGGRPMRRHAAPARRARPSPSRCPRHNPWPRPRARARLPRARARPPRLLPHGPPIFKHLRFWPAGRPGPPPDSAARCWWLGRSVGQPADHFRRSSRAQGGKDATYRVGSAAEQHSGERGPQGLLRRLALFAPVWVVPAAP
jgi:hypothetical protein